MNFLYRILGFVDREKAAFAALPPTKKREVISIAAALSAFIIAAVLLLIFEPEIFLFSCIAVSLLAYWLYIEHKKKKRAAEQKIRDERESVTETFFELFAQFHRYLQTCCPRSINDVLPEHPLHRRGEAIFLVFSLQKQSDFSAEKYDTGIWLQAIIDRYLSCQAFNIDCSPCDGYPAIFVLKVHDSEHFVDFEIGITRHPHVLDYLKRHTKPLKSTLV